MWMYEEYDVNWGELVEGTFALSQHRTQSISYTTTYAIGTAYDVSMAYKPWSVDLVTGPTESSDSQYEGKHGWVYERKSGHAVVVASSLPVIPAEKLQGLLLTVEELRQFDSLELLTDGVKLLRREAVHVGALLYAVEESITRIDFNVTSREQRRDFAAAICPDGDDVVAWAKERHLECGYHDSVLWVELPPTRIDKKALHRSAMSAALRVAPQAVQDVSWTHDIEGLRYQLYLRKGELERAKARKLQSAWNKAEDENFTTGRLSSALTEALLKTYMPASVRRAIASYYAMAPYSLPALMDLARDGAGIPVPWPLAVQRKKVVA